MNNKQTTTDDEFCRAFTDRIRKMTGYIIDHVAAYGEFAVALATYPGDLPGDAQELREVAREIIGACAKASASAMELVDTIEYKSRLIGAEDYAHLIHALEDSAIVTGKATKHYDSIATMILTQPDARNDALQELSQAAGRAMTESCRYYAALTPILMKLTRQTGHHAWLAAIFEGTRAAALGVRCTPHETVDVSSAGGPARRPGVGAADRRQAARQ